MDEQMYESRESMPVYQSSDLDFEAARAEWGRDRQAAAWADYCQDMAERQEADDADLGFKEWVAAMEANPDD